jgi:hypothetical protein
VQIVRFALNTNTVHRAVLPNVTATVAVAQHIRTVTLGIFGKQNSGKLSPRLTGKSHTQGSDLWQVFDQNDVSVESLRDHHGHAFWWLTDEDRDGFLDHLNVVCANGFSRADVAALQSLVQVRQRDGFPDLLLTPIFIGRLDALKVPGFFNHQQETKTFVSATPYFCPLHLSHGKSGGSFRSVAKVVKESLKQLCLSDKATVEELFFDYDPSNREAPLPTASVRQLGPLYAGAFTCNPDDPCPHGQYSGIYVAEGTRFIHALKFASTRRNDQTKGPGRLSCITFDKETPARPFALGKFSHFGLGLFVPVFTV